MATQDRFKSYDPALVEFSSRLAEAANAGGLRPQYSPDDAQRMPTAFAGAAGGSVIAWRPPKDARPDDIEVQLAAALVRQCADAAAQVNQIRQNPRLSVDARQQDQDAALARLAPQFADLVRKCEAQVAAAEQGYLTATTPPALEPGDAAGAMADWEIRRWAAKLGPDEQTRVAQRAMTGQDDRVAVALKRSPVPLPSILHGSLPPIWEGWLTRNRGDLFAAAQRKRELGEWLQIVLGHAQAYPRQAGTVRAKAA